MKEKWYFLLALAMLEMTSIVYGSVEAWSMKGIILLVDIVIWFAIASWLYDRHGDDVGETHE